MAAKKLSYASDFAQPLSVLHPESTRRLGRGRSFFRASRVGLALLIAGIAGSFTPGLYAQTFLEQLERRLRTNPPPEDPAAAADQPSDAAEVPSAQSGYLGVVGDDYGQRVGVEVLEVRANSPAQRAGLRPRDRIVQIDNTAIPTLDALSQFLQSKRAGDRLTVRVRRAGSEVVLNAELSARPTRRTPTPLPAESRRPVVGTPAAEPYLGIAAETLTEAARVQWGLSVRRGAIVTSVQAGSPAERAGIRAGNVIVQANGRRVDDFQDLAVIMQRMNPGEQLQLTFYDRRNNLETVTILFPATAANPGGPLVREYENRDASPLNELEARRPLLGRIGRLVEQLADQADPEPPYRDEPFDPSGIYGPTPRSDGLESPYGPDLAAPQNRDEPQIPLRGDALPADLSRQAEREAALAREVDLLRREMQLMRGQIELLQQRLDRLERE